jgi:hypothetical protein
MRVRLRSLAFVVAIIALVTALVVQSHREAVLRAQLQAARAEKDLVEIELVELDIIHKQEVARLRSQIADPPGPERKGQAGLVAESNRK